MNLENTKHAVTHNKKKEIFINAYDEYFDQIYRFIYFKVGNAEDAQDLTSAAFLKAWNYVKDNKIKNKTLRALIYKIARNTVIDFYRSKTAGGQNSAAISSLNGAINIADEKQDIISQAELASDMSLVEKGMMELKDEYREIIILRFTEELSISEIARILEKPKGNVRVLTYRALKALRDVLDNVNADK
ncbi:MAG: sigma-70 family RNA polymerase sigma factor [Actinobacteria bacterium]|nr:sigma-70 family RNA polymerase sigma factor [Actinomycetota bacterium]